VAQQAGTADFVIRNVQIIDGTGAPSRLGSVAVTDDRITGVGDLAQDINANLSSAGSGVTVGDAPDQSTFQN